MAREQSIFAINPKRYTARTTIQHWQLRDLIVCPGNNFEFAYVSANNVVAYDSFNQKKTDLLSDLAFSPTCITSACGYVAVGGQRSQIALRSVATEYTALVNVGGSINNSICVANQSDGNTRMFICNNDETIKVYSVPDMQAIKTIQLPTAVNYCSVSPDGILQFSCAWNQSSEKLAVASQDGFVSIWDVRMSTRLAQIKSHQYGQVKGACRTVKFTPSGSIDLLLFSEHVSYINIVDARTFNEQQAIRVCPEGSDAHISGLCISPDSSKVYVGLENAVAEWSIDTISRRSFPEGSLR